MADQQAKLETGIICRLFPDADFGFIEPSDGSGAYSPVFFHAMRLAPGVLPVIE